MTWLVQGENTYFFFFKARGWWGTAGINPVKEVDNWKPSGQEDPYLVYDGKRHVKNKEPQTSLLVQE